MTQENWPFSCVVVIPVYRHGRTVGAVIDEAISLGFDVVVVDDGCDRKTANLLRKLAEDRQQMTLLRHPVNRGKGAAVWTAFDECSLREITYAITVDADGQHLLSDIQRFLQPLVSTPLGAIFGEPVFDDNTPKARLHGRKITNFFGRLEMGGAKVKDLLFGFRVYPVELSLKLFREGRIGLRMNFDPEIAVNLVWEGIEIFNIPSQVSYPKDGVSNFRMLRDNLSFSSMHTRLLCRRGLHNLGFNPKREHTSWNKMVELGGPWGLKFMQWIFRFGGRHLARIILYPVVFYFFLFTPKRREYSRTFLERVCTLGGSIKKRVGAWDVYRHYLEFAHTCLDKAICWAGQTDHFRLTFKGYEEVRDLSFSGQGSLLLGSHVGSLEIIRAFTHQHKPVTVNVFMYTVNAKSFQGVLNSLNQESNVNVIAVEEITIATAMSLKEKVDQGELVALLGDRSLSHDNFSSQIVDFMGGAALFPEGPHLLSVLLQCPIYTVFSLRTGPDTYSVKMEPLADGRGITRNERNTFIKNSMEKYANRLESIVLKHPYQWFNFYDFWKNNDLEKVSDD
jgi:predicted LPLAT superfamily acyltransferase